MAQQCTANLYTIFSLLAAILLCLHAATLVAQKNTGLRHRRLLELSQAKLDEADHLQQQQQQSVHTDAAVEQSTRNKIAVLYWKCCNMDAYSEEQSHTCLAEIEKKCSGLDSADCFWQAWKEGKSCPDKTPRGYKVSFMAAVARTVPYLQTMGWDVQHARSPFLESEDKFHTTAPCCQVDDFKAASMKLVEESNVIIIPLDSFFQVSKLFPEKKYILVDVVDSAMLKLRKNKGDSEAEDPRVLAILKPQVLDPPELNNLLFKYDGSLPTHLPKGADIDDLLSNTKYEKSGPGTGVLSPEALAKIKPLVPHIFRYRFPTDCGGKNEFARFSGFFSGNTTTWNPPPLKERKVDVAFMGKVTSGLYEKSPSLANHRKDALAAITAVGAQHPELNVVTEANKVDKLTYFKNLQDIKIFVSPYGAGEWSHKDFEALIAGCLVVKPRAQNVIAYPNIFQAGHTVLSTELDFSDLEQQVMAALEDIDNSQIIVQNAQSLLRQYSDLHQYAGDLSNLFVELGL